MNHLEVVADTYMRLDRLKAGDFSKYGLVQMRHAIVYLEEAEKALARLRRGLEAEVDKARRESGLQNAG